MPKVNTNNNLDILSIKYETILGSQSNQLSYDIFVTKETNKTNNECIAFCSFLDGQPSKHQINLYLSNNPGSRERILAFVKANKYSLKAAKEYIKDTLTNVISTWSEIENKLMKD